MDGQASRRGEGRRPPLAARHLGVLVVDDVASVLTGLKFELEARGFVVWLAVDGDDALDLYRKHRAQIDLVLLDVEMPGLDGPRTLDALRLVNPEVAACFLTGDHARPPGELFGRGASGVFSKPLCPGEVAARVESWRRGSAPLPGARLCLRDR